MSEGVKFCAKLESGVNGELPNEKGKATSSDAEEHRIVLETAPPPSGGSPISIAGWEAALSRFLIKTLAGLDASGSVDALDNGAIGLFWGARTPPGAAFSTCLSSFFISRISVLQFSTSNEVECILATTVSLQSLYGTVRSRCNNTTCKANAFFSDWLRCARFNSPNSFQERGLNVQVFVFVESG